MSYLNEEMKILEIVALDSDACDGTDRDTATTWDFSLQKIDDESKAILNDNAIDAGRGGTGIGLGKELHSVGCTVSTDDFLVVTCLLHVHSLTFSSPITKYIGTGAIRNRTVLQLLYSVYELQEEYKTIE